MSNIILSVYITGKIDPARKIIWQRNINNIMTLINSIKDNEELIILNNCFKEQYIKNAYLKKVIAYDIDVYFQKWFLCYDYLQEHEEIEKVWIVDVSDVEMLRNPFPEMNEKIIYVGSEEEYLNNEWMRINHQTDFILEFFKNNANLKLLNAGLLGGSRIDIMNICKAQIDFYNNNKEKHDMGSYNYILYTNYKDNIEYGSKINTIFKKYEENNYIAWWKHK